MSKRLGINIPRGPRLSDAKTDRAIRGHERALDEIAKSVGVGMKALPNIELADGVETPIAHGLGRAPLFVRESCVRGAMTTGHIEDVRDGTQFSRTTHIVLKATGYGATVTVDVVVA